MFSARRHSLIRHSLIRHSLIRHSLIRYIMQSITLYSKPGCHLCEDGEWILEIALKGRDVPVSKIDISTDPALTARYGTRIPVLCLPEQNTELDWPFIPETIISWLDEAADQQIGK